MTRLLKKVQKPGKYYYKRKNPETYRNITKEQLQDLRQLLQAM